MDFFFLGLEESLGSDNKFVKLNELVDFEKFRKSLKGIYTQDMTRQGRPAYDCVMMFKLLLLGQWYNFSDRELASSLRLRIDFMYFTGFTPTSKLPDYSTINKYCNLLIEKKELKKLFKELNSQLESLGLSINTAKGAIIDATLIESAGRPDKFVDNPVEDRYENESSNLNISYGKDKDAKWIKKGNKSHYGYKVFTSVDDEHGFIQTIHTESAEVYEAHRLEIILKDLDCKHVLADKAYDTTANQAMLKERNIKNRILKKAVRNKPLTKRQKTRNILISKVRYKVEQCHGLKGLVFGDRGYISKDKAQLLEQQGLKLITTLKKNMKKVLRTRFEKAMLAKRSIIETIFDYLKNNLTLWHTRHRSVNNAFTHLMAALAQFIISPIKINNYKYLDMK